MRTSDVFFAEATDAFVSVYRGFLHLRLLSYIDEVAGRMPTDLSDEKLNPLKLRFLVEIGFRGNLVVQQLLNEAQDIGGEDFAAELRSRVAEVQEHHTIRLFTAVNGLLEMTFLDRQFHDGLPALLAGDRLGPIAPDVDLLRALDESDSQWQSLAAETVRRSLG